MSWNFQNINSKTLPCCSKWDVLSHYYCVKIPSGQMYALRNITRKGLMTFSTIADREKCSCSCCPLYYIMTRLKILGKRFLCGDCTSWHLVLNLSSISCKFYNCWYSPLSFDHWKLWPHNQAWTHHWLHCKTKQQNKLVLGTVFFSYSCPRSNQIFQQIYFT